MQQKKEIHNNDIVASALFQHIGASLLLRWDVFAFGLLDQSGLKNYDKGKVAELLKVKNVDHQNSMNNEHFLLRNMPFLSRSISHNWFHQK